MANNLKSFKFTNKADTAISVTGWEVLESVVINALAGNDIIKGTSSTYSGIFNDGTIDTGAGNDTIIGTGSGYGILNYGTINTGDGKDKILLGKGKYQISDSKIVGTVRGDWEKIMAYEFEKIGGVNGGLFDFKDGILTVDIEGVGTFA